MRVVLGDLEAVVGAVGADTVLCAVAGATLGEVTARQIPLLPNPNVDRIVVWLGRAEVLAGHDESFVHAELVALCDALLGTAAPSSILVNGFPPVADRNEQVRLFDAAARSTCELRGILWQSHPGRAHRS